MKKVILLATMTTILALCGCRLIENQADDPNSYMNQNIQTIETTTKGVGSMLPFPFNLIAIAVGTASGAGWRQYVEGRKRQKADASLADVSENAKRLGLTLASVTQAIDAVKANPATSTQVQELKDTIVDKMNDLGIKKADADYLIDIARTLIPSEKT